MTMDEDLIWTSNIWAGTSVENKDNLDRLEYLRRVPAAVRFLSVEPLLGSIPDMDLTRISQIIVGGESGPKARPMEESWALRIKDICKEQGVAFYFKQMGGKGKDKGGKLLAGVTIQEWPHVKYPLGLDPHPKTLMEIL